MDSAIQNPIKAPRQVDRQKWLCLLVWKIAIATLVLMAIGSATRVMNAGLACPDWPLCYGKFVPVQEMNLQVFLEWFHRLDAGLIGISTLALSGFSWWYRKELPSWLPTAATFALFLVIFQGILGALTVTELLRFDIVTAHLGTALLFFSTLILIGCQLTPYQPTTTGGRLFWTSLVATVFLYLQSLLGGVIASRWALHQCLGTSQLCVVMNSHILGVVPTTLAILLLVWQARRTAGLHPLIGKLVGRIFLLVILQILLGTSTFWFRLQVEILTVTHQAIGATLLGALVAVVVFAYREKIQVVYPIQARY